MRISCGFIIKFNNMVLLCHPTKAFDNKSFSFPKGGTEKKDASFIDTAIRECVEEVGIHVNRKLISKNFVVDYTKTNSTKVVKQVHLFLAEITDLKQIGLNQLEVPLEQLQLEEVDWAGFLTKEQSIQKIFWRFKHILEEIL